MRNVKIELNTEFLVDDNFDMDLEDARYKVSIIDSENKERVLVVSGHWVSITEGPQELNLREVGKANLEEFKQEMYRYFRQVEQVIDAVADESRITYAYDCLGLMIWHLYKTSKCIISDEKLVKILYEYFGLYFKDKYYTSNYATQPTMLQEDETASQISEYLSDLEEIAELLDIGIYGNSLVVDEVLGLNYENMLKFIKTLTVGK